MGAKVSFAFRSQKALTFIASPKQENLVALTELLEAGTVTPVIDRTYSLSETADAVRYVGQGHARGKVVIRA
jgi:NADPH:quinone reductase-like Zn-dependent oxidoreductase